MIYNNEMTLTIKSLSENESFARSCVASFCLPLSPSLEEINDIKTSVSEAVTNCVVHAYPNKVGDIILNVKIVNNAIYITIKDFGIGIENINIAKEPFYTSKPEAERSGMGFTVMESFMDSVEVVSAPGIGTTIILQKKVGEVASAVGG